MRRSIAALALIRRAALGRGDEWLVNWNEGWQALHLVGGHKREHESFSECCVREVIEELSVTPADFTIAAEPTARLEYVAHSRRAGAATAYTIELFAVELRDAARARVAADRQCAWIGEREIRGRRAEDGRAVSETVELLLVRAGLLPPRRESTGAQAASAESSEARHGP